MERRVVRRKRYSVERPLGRRERDAIFAALKHDGADARAAFFAALEEDAPEDGIEDGIEDTSSDGSPRARYVPSFPIKSVDLHRRTLRDDGARKLAEALATNHTLESLDVSDCRITVHGGVALLSFAGMHPNLTKLSMASNRIKSRGAVVLYQALCSPHSRLRILNMSYNAIDEEAADQLGEMLSVNNTLQFLTLNWNILGSTQAMSVICQGLKQNTALQHLSLSRNGICDRDVGALADALQNHPTFEELDLSFNPSMTGAHVDRLVTANCPLKLLNLRQCVRCFESHHLIRALASPRCSLRELMIPIVEPTVKCAELLVASMAKNRSLRSLWLYGFPASTEMGAVTSFIGRVIMGVCSHPTLRELYFSDIRFAVSHVTDAEFNDAFSRSTLELLKLGPGAEVGVEDTKRLLGAIAANDRMMELIWDPVQTVFDDQSAFRLFLHTIKTNESLQRILFRKTFVLEDGLRYVIDEHMARNTRTYFKRVSAALYDVAAVPEDLGALIAEFICHSELRPGGGGGGSAETNAHTVDDENMAARLLRQPRGLFSWQHVTEFS